MRFESSSAGGGGGSVPDLQVAGASFTYTGAYAMNSLLTAPAGSQIQLYGIETNISFSVFGPADAGSGGLFVVTEAGSVAISTLTSLVFTIGDLAASQVLVYPPQALYTPIPGLIIPVGQSLALQANPIAVGGSCTGDAVGLVYYTLI